MKASYTKYKCPPPRERRWALQRALGPQRFRTVEVDLQLHSTRDMKDGEILGTRSGAGHDRNRTVLNQVFDHFFAVSPLFRGRLQNQQDTGIFCPDAEFEEGNLLSLRRLRTVKNDCFPHNRIVFGILQAGNKSKVRTAKRRSHRRVDRWNLNFQRTEGRFTHCVSPQRTFTPVEGCWPSIVLVLVDRNL